MSVIEQTQRPTSARVAESNGLAWWQAGVAGVVAAAAANLVIYAIARGAGASFEFVDGDTQETINAAAVATLTVVPMAVGFVLAVLVSLRWQWALRAGAVVGAALALLTIALPFTVDADGGTQAALSVMHVAVAAGIVLAFEAYRRRRVSATGTS
jgi:hypothetical protein